MKDEDLIERLKMYHEREICWGSLHIVLDDGNLEDEWVEYCIGYAKREEDSEGEYLAQKLLKLPFEVREELYHSLNRRMPLGSPEKLTGAFKCFPPTQVA